jgi:small subunit ribosomal protein S9
MTDEPKNDEISEPVTDEGSSRSAADPVEDDGGVEDDPARSSPPSSSPPAEEAFEGPSEEVGVEPEVVEEEEETEVAVAESSENVPGPPERKKADVIPGADLEPIAVEPEAAPLSAEEQARLEAEEEERARREAELAGETEEPDAASRAPAKMESGARYLATGKRKNAIARVTLTPGDGKFEVNKRALEEFFPRPLHQTMARQPLVTTGYEGNVDVRVLVHGGGVSGQAGAVRHGIARALTEIDVELRGDLKRRGFLTRDARVKERRKAGLKKARKRPQFSKR